MTAITGRRSCCRERDGEDGEGENDKKGLYALHFLHVDDHDNQMIPSAFVRCEAMRHILPMSLCRRLISALFVAPGRRISVRVPKTWRGARTVREIGTILVDMGSYIVSLARMNHTFPTAAANHPARIGQSLDPPICSVSTRLHRRISVSTDPGGCFTSSRQKSVTHAG